MSGDNKKITGRQLVEGYIREHEGCTHTEITKALKIKTETVGSALALLKRARIIESRGVPGQMRYYMLSTVIDGNELAFGAGSGTALLNRLLAGVRG